MDAFHDIDFDFSFIYFAKFYRSSFGLSHRFFIQQENGAYLRNGEREIRSNHVFSVVISLVYEHSKIPVSHSYFYFFTFCEHILDIESSWISSILSLWNRKYSFKQNVWNEIYWNQQLSIFISVNKLMENYYAIVTASISIFHCNRYVTFARCSNQYQR